MVLYNIICSAYESRDLKIDSLFFSFLFTNVDLLCLQDQKLKDGFRLKAVEDRYLS